MNITEGNAANVVLRYLLGLAPVPSDDDALAAARDLAERANKVLHAGLRGADVDAAWKRVIVCPEVDA